MDLIKESRLESLKDYFSREASIFARFDVSQISELVEKLEVTRANSGRVFIAGNGGSAATAEHFAVDLGVGAQVRTKNKALDAIALTANAAILTAIGNDVDFKSVFSKQLETHRPNENDFVISISASGNSPNILRLLDSARVFEVKSCAITGFDGGIARSLADISIHVPTEPGEYGIVEDAHLAICHAISETLRK